MKKESIPFVKMQGTGNDFVVLDNREETWSLEEIVEHTPRLCNRRFGVGADGLLALNPASQSGLNYTMIYRNADGSDAGMCGNGSRCLALFASELGMGNTLKFSVHGNIYSAEVNDSGQVVIDFPGETEVREIRDDDDSILYQVYPGTEHVVRKVAEPTLKNEKQLTIEGQKLRKHSMFQPEGTNVNFMYCRDEGQLSVHTYERGVEDLTLACGTGAIASALACHHIQESSSAENVLEVETKGGILRVYFRYSPESGTYTGIRLEGPARFVFEGSFYL